VKTLSHNPDDFHCGLIPAPRPQHPDACSSAADDYAAHVQAERERVIVNPARCPAGYREALCQGCRVALYVEVGAGGFVLCSRCRRAVA
jgi:hypothetical protein